MWRRNCCIMLLFMSVLPVSQHVQAQEVRDSVRIYFRQGRSELDMSVRNNRAALGRIADSLSTSYADSVYILRKILVEGGASPEGSIPLNRKLSEKRAETLFGYLSQYGELPDSLTTFRFIGRDWAGLLRLAEADEDLPYREQTLDFLRQVAEKSQSGERAEDNYIGKLTRLAHGKPYRYMYRQIFPDLRASRLHLWYRKVWNPLKTPVPAPFITPLPLAMPERAEVPYTPVPPQKPFYMAVKTNLLYDAALIPNIGVEFYLKDGWSIGAGWMYGWWKKDRIHWYWRAYGGDVTVRKWLGKKAEEKPLTGHHIGVYGQVLTYDFETGGRGYMGGEPGGSLFDRANFVGGIEYGYALPVARRLNLDFSIGIGYMGGKYHEYVPMDDCYVWQATKQRHYFGPTRLEVSLVWLLGQGNINKMKGGRR